MYTSITNIYSSLLNVSQNYWNSNTSITNINSSLLNVSQNYWNSNTSITNINSSRLNVSQNYWNSNTSITNLATTYTGARIVLWPGSGISTSTDWYGFGMNSGQMVQNVPSGQTHSFQVNGTAVVAINSGNNTRIYNRYTDRHITYRYTSNKFRSLWCVHL